MFLVAIIAISFLIFVHELGHFVAAKLLGVKVSEFFLGFGPKILRIRKGETAYGIGSIPLGGYVRMVGMGWEEQAPSEDAHRSFSNQPIWSRVLIISAGPLMNLIVALFLFLAVFLIMGTPFFPSKIVGVLKNSPADVVGMKDGDRIITVKGQKVTSAQEIVKIIKSNPGREIRIVVTRENSEDSENKIVFTPRLADKDKKGFLGVEFKVEFRKRGLIDAFIHSTRTTAIVTSQVLIYLKNFPKVINLLLAGKVSGISGPVGIYRITTHVAYQGLVALLSLMAALSISLGVFNLLPLPPLDGGHVLFAGIELVRRKPLDRNIMIFIQAIGISLLLFLLLLVTYSDIINPIPRP